MNILTGDLKSMTAGELSMLQGMVIAEFVNRYGSERTKSILLVAIEMMEAAERRLGKIEPKGEAK